MEEKKLIRKKKSELLEMLKAQGKKADPKAQKQQLVDLILTPKRRPKRRPAEKAKPKKQAKKNKAVKRKQAAKPKIKARKPEAEAVRAAQQQVEETKYSTEAAPPPTSESEGPAASAPGYESGAEVSYPTSLPKTYGDDCIMAMVRDPYWIFTYWELAPESLRQGRRTFGEQGDRAKTALRVYDITGIAFTGENANSHFDIDVGDANNWYINTGWPNRSYCVDIGLLGPEGTYHTIARSNPAHTPRAAASEEVDERWMSLEEEFERIYAASGGFNVGEGSVELREMMEKQLQMQLASEAVGSLFSMAVPQKEERGFWLDVNTELIVYGATRADAAVTIQGKPVRLRADGTFSVRFALPDGEQVIPVTAQSADGIEERTITPTVRRTTTTQEAILAQ